VSLAVLGLVAAPAVAADPASDGYNAMPISVPPTVKGASAVNSPAANAGSGAAPVAAVTPATSASSGGSLPFTGLDLGLVIGAAVLLLGLGFALRRGTRTES